MILLILFVLVFFICINKKPLIEFLLIIQICSLLGYTLIDKSANIESLYSLFNLFITAVYLLLIISPWYSYGNILDINIENENVLKRFTNILFIISFYTFVVLLATAILVNVLISDINTFKYGGGSVEFYYTMLPFNVRFLILAYYLYGVGYFMIPLHFYYLSKRKYCLSFFCFLFSLNIILYGLTYFSRAAIINYVFVYFAIFLILYKSIPLSVLDKLKKIILFVFFLGGCYFLFVTFSRFDESSIYSNMIPRNSFIQNAVIYSICDYLSQWYPLSFEVLNDYSGLIFNGETSFKSLLALLNYFDISDFDLEKYNSYRRYLWKNNAGNFVGYVAYIIYDFGYIFSLLINIIYFCIVRLMKPRMNKIKLFNLFYVVLLIQIPLMAIFYSVIDQIVIPFIFLFLLHLFSKLRFSIKNSQPFL